MELKQVKGWYNLEFIAECNIITIILHSNRCLLRVLGCFFEFALDPGRIPGFYAKISPDPLPGRSF